MAYQWRQLGNVPACVGATGAVAAGEKIVVVAEDGKLWWIEPREGAPTDRLGDGEIHARVVAAGRGLTYVFADNGMLFALDERGQAERLDGDWSEVTVAAGSAAELFAVRGVLHFVEPDGGWRELGDHEWTPKLMLAGDVYLFLLEENGGLFRIDLFDVSIQQLDGDWGDVTAGARVGEALYFSSMAGWLYQVSSEGDCVPMECGVPPDTRFLVGTEQSLYAIDAGGALHVLAAA